MMYQSYWQLTKRPFESGCDVWSYYPSETHQAAMLKLRYVIENQLGSALVAGPPGVGKTLIVTVLRANLTESFAPFIHLVFPQMDTEELLAYLATELDPSIHLSTKPTMQETIRQIEHYLVENTKHGRHAVVIIDEAQLITDSRTLEALRLLLNFELAGRPALTLILVGQPSVLPTLDHMPQLEERLGVKCLLRPFAEHETVEYIQHRLKIAGVTQSIFKSDAMQTIHQLTNGIPRRINRLCDLALLIGYADKKPSIDSDHLESINRELVTVTPE